MAVDPVTGTLYVADYNGNRTTVLDRAGNRLAYIADTADHPQGIELDPASGVLFVSHDNPAGTGDHLLIFNATNYDLIGNITTTFGNYTGIAADPITGTVYVAEKGLHRVSAFNQTYAFGVAGADDGETLTVRMQADRVETPGGLANVESGAASIEIAPMLRPTISTVQAGSPALQDVPFNLTFNRHIDASTLDATDIAPSSGTVRDLRTAWTHDASFGTLGSGNDQLDNPYGVAVNGSGHVFVADRDNNRIQIFNSTMDHVATLEDSFNFPYGVAVDGSDGGRIYVADTVNNRVRVYDSGLNPIGTVVDPISRPYGVAVNGSGHVFVASFNRDLVAVFNSTWGHVTDIQNGFNRPSGVAIDSDTGTMYVADGNNHRIQIFDRARQYVADIPGSFNYSSGVAIDGPSGNIYVADDANGRIQIFNSTLHSIGNVTNMFTNSTGVAIDGASGTVYAADFNNHRIQSFDISYAFNVTGADAGETLAVHLPADRVETPGGTANVESNPASVQIALAPPAVTITSEQHPGPTNATTINFNVTFSRGVSNFVAADIAVSGNATTGGVANFAGSGDRYTFDVVPTGDGTVTVDVAAGVAEDDQGNANQAAPRFSIVSDRTPPEPVITSAQHPGPTNARTIGFNVTFVMGAAGFDGTDITLGGNATLDGSVKRFAKVSDSLYTFEVTPTGDGTILVDIAAGAARDTAGNPSVRADRYAIRYDGTAPVPTVTSVEDPGPTNAATVLFAVNFTDSITGKPEPVNYFAAANITVAGVGDVTLAGGGIQNFEAYNGSSYTFELTPDGNGTVRVDVPADVARDDAGNNNTAADRYEIDYDDQAPYARITSVLGPGPTGASAIGFEVGFGEEVRNFDQTDITVSGTAGATTLVGFARDGLNYTFSVAPITDGTVTVDIGAGAAQDTAGNDNTAAPRYSIEYDSTLQRTDITSTQSDPTNSATVNFEVDFVNAVNGFVSTDIDLSGSTAPNGGLANFAGADGATSYTFDVTATGDGTLTVNVAAGAGTYVSGGDDTEAASYSIVYDGTQPAPGITPVLPGPTNATRVGFQLAFDGGVDDIDPSTFEASDIEASSGRVQIPYRTLQPGATFGTEGSAAGQFDVPTGVAVNGTGHIFVADSDNGRVEVYDGALNRIATVTDPVHEPFGLAFNGTGHLFVADGISNRVTVFDTARNRIATITDGFNRATGVAFNGTGHLFVADRGGNRVAVFDTARNHLDDITRGFAGTPDVKVDPATGNVYVVDQGGDRISIFGPARNHITDIGSLDNPIGIALDAATGNIYVAEWTGGSAGDDRIQVFNGTRHSVANVTATFGNYTGIAINGATGTVYAVEKDSHRVRTFDTVYGFDVADPADQATLTVSLPAGRVQDAAGNDNTPSGTESVVIDRAAPAPVITTTARTDPTGASTIGFEVGFGESVNDFAATDITVSGTAVPDPVTAVTPDGINYTFSVSPTTDGTVLVDIGAGAARDEAGNPSTAATQFSITYDSTLQRTDITSVQSGPTNVATINFEIDFVNAVTGFDHTDIDLSDSTAPNGGVDNFAGADGATSYTFDVTATGDGNVTVDIAASAGTYVGGTDTTDEATYTVRYDGTAPVSGRQFHATPRPDQRGHRPLLGQLYRTCQRLCRRRRHGRGRGGRHPDRRHTELCKCQRLPLYLPAHPRRRRHHQGGRARRRRRRRRGQQQHGRGPVHHRIRRPGPLHAHHLRPVRPDRRPDHQLRGGIRRGGPRL